MESAHQDRAVQRYHRAMAQRDKTCVDCHAEVGHPTEVVEAAISRL